MNQAMTSMNLLSTCLQQCLLKHRIHLQGPANHEEVFQLQQETGNALQVAHRIKTPSNFLVNKGNL
jgi:hypothetical protein